MSIKETAEDREDLGFRQGTSIDPSALQAGDCFPFYTGSTDDRLVLLTQSCDILHCGPEGDSFLEGVVAAAITELDGNYTNGKHPRILHIGCTCNPSHAFEIKIKNRILIKREALKRVSPKEGCTFDSDAVRTLAFWFGRRYFRSAFPESFSKRITPKQQRKLKKLIRGTHEVVTGIYFRLNTFDELPEGQPYCISVYVTSDPGDWADAEKRKALYVFADSLEAILASDSIVVDTCDPVPETDFDLHTASHSLRMDSFDYLTFSETLGEDGVDGA